MFECFFFFIILSISPLSCSVPCRFPFIHHLPAMPRCLSSLSILLIRSLSLQMESLFGSLPEMLDFQRVFLQTLEERIASSPDFSTLETPSQFKVRRTHSNISHYRFNVRRVSVDSTSVHRTALFSGQVIFTAGPNEKHYLYRS